MSPEQRRTVKRLAVSGLLFAGCVGYLLWTEAAGIRQGGRSSISEVAWLVWTLQPWTVWLVSVLLAFVVGFFSGHFVGQSSDVYDAIRRGER